MNKHKKFIKDCYNGKHGSICSEWKETILKHYPEFETQFKIGDWIIITKTWLKENTPKGYVSQVTFSDGKILQFKDKNGEIFTVTKPYIEEPMIRTATEQEVFEALKNEAIKRGFKEGVITKDVWGHLSYNERELEDDGRGFYLFEYNDLWYGCNMIFKNGKWAEIVSKKKMTLKEVEKELGYEIEITE